MLENRADRKIFWKGEVFMRITDLLDKRSILLDASPKSKPETLDTAVELMAKSGKIKDIEAIKSKMHND